MSYQHLEVDLDGHVATLWLNRPDKLNAMSMDIWADIPAAMQVLDAEDSVRVVVVAGRGEAFTVGIDLNMLASLRPGDDSAAAENMAVYEKIKNCRRQLQRLPIHPNL